MMHRQLRDSGVKPSAVRPTLAGLWLAAVLLAVLSLLPLTAAFAQAPTPTGNAFSRLVADTRVSDVKRSPQGQVQVPFITWGGDVATMLANGGLATQPGSMFQSLNLNVNLVNGDDFVGQVRRYLSGESPFLRGELRMLALASEVIGSDPRTKPVVFLQLTWSAGDHMVARPTVKTLNDLKGKRIALQRNGPHVGMLDDVLRTLKLTWSDVTVVWTDKLTGPGGPAEAFRNDPKLDACFVISPDMIGLTGGLEGTGSGAEGTVKDARVVVSTAQMSRAIADVYAVRSDFYAANRDFVERFTAGYLKATERLVALRTDFSKPNATLSPDYRQLLTLAQTILGKDVLPTLEVDAHGLLADAIFVGLPGNRGFFTDKTAPDGFEQKGKSAIDLAVGQGYAAIRAGLMPHDLDYQKIASLGGLTITQAATGAAGRFQAESVETFPTDALDDKTILSFTIGFDVNQSTFSQDVYGPEFLRAVRTASTFGSAVVAVRGHADTTKLITDILKAGMEKKVITRTGTPGNFRYFSSGRPLDLANIGELLKLVEAGGLEGGEVSPRDTYQAALNLSRQRAEAVRDAIVEFAKNNGLRLDRSQIQAVGVGVAEPVVPTPRSADDAKQNRRVEFRIVRVPAESVKPQDFDY
jgi:outer membrane protein OmpA-like peptidoglycan-associated protein